MTPTKRKRLHLENGGPKPGDYILLRENTLQWKLPRNNLTTFGSKATLGETNGLVPALVIALHKHLEMMFVYTRDCKLCWVLVMQRHTTVCG